MKTNAGNINIKNKRATFDYELVDTYTAGIVLTGTEIKSIRLGKGKSGRYVLLLRQWRAMGEEYAYCRIIFTVRTIIIMHVGSANCC